LDDSARQSWSDIRDRIDNTVPAKISAGNWDALRTPFETIAVAMIETDYRFGHPDSAEHFVTFCPMAFDNAGAYWLSDTNAIANPYFGHKMLKCGKVTDQIGPQGGK